MSSTDLSGSQWQKSSYSNGQANCVEVATLGSSPTVVAVRDSKMPGGGNLIFSEQAWRRFTDATAMITEGTRVSCDQLEGFTRTSLRLVTYLSAARGAGLPTLPTGRRRHPSRWPCLTDQVLGRRVTILSV